MDDKMDEESNKKHICIFGIHVCEYFKFGVHMLILVVVKVIEWMIRDSYNELNCQFGNIFELGCCPHYWIWIILAMGNTLGMNICFLQVLVTFHELQKTLEHRSSSLKTKFEWDLHQSILETLKNLHAVWGLYMKTWIGSMVASFRERERERANGVPSIKRALRENTLTIVVTTTKLRESRFSIWIFVDVSYIDLLTRTFEGVNVIFRRQRTRKQIE